MVAWKKNFICVDCEVDTFEIHEYYMVKPRIWRKYGTKRRMLCIGCLSKRMGRELHSGDFLRCPLNNEPLWTKSERLQQALRR